ncbi:NAD(P)-binding domain-containing protein [Acinetobacter sp. B5B]|uniref:flavin-containing monooxygenase n=1 Tax=Acinetobacter baretiae TaxID=2605383 RepID=UPI0018C2320C|nr:NAD(P)/FAD-dependent oxidoreductase [Acinetobacter baretiae]MBF7681893.1 NAD(P)-binding domain-containing protein [Acinetobacter baretiae]
MQLPKRIDTVVIGGGQAGIAMSEHLTASGTAHIVLEKSRIAEAWRSRRWDSLVANGPCWHDRFPQLNFPQAPDDFVHHDQVADYFEAYAKHIHAPIFTNTEVLNVSKIPAQPNYLIETTQGTVIAERLVIATGPFQKAVIPSIAPKTSTLYQIHSDQYKNTQQLPQGAVLVVGAGSSGVQIADELNRAGKKVFLSVGQHERPPRRYRGRDNVWWLGVLGGWDVEKPNQGPLKGFAVSGAHGGQSVDFKKLVQQGITLVGMTKTFTQSHVTFQEDLAKNIHEGERCYLKLLDEADVFIKNNGLSLPEDPEARVMLEDPACITQPILSLDLAQENIQSVIWASGFSYDYSWLNLDVLDEQSQPKHRYGVTDLAGVYFLGLPYLTGRGSSFIWGVWHDAKRIADHMSIQKTYLQYLPLKQHASTVE